MLGFAAANQRSVAICICTRDRPEELAEALASIALSGSPVDRVVVSDDGADPRTRQVCFDALIDVDYISGPHRGLGANRNSALDRVGEDVVLFIDDDCLLGCDFLRVALACMAEEEHTYGAGRVIVSGVEINNGTLIHAAAQTFLGFQARPYLNGDSMTSIVINATLFPGRLFETLRFNEQIRYGYEEVDLATRAAFSGYRIISCRHAVNDHRPSPRSRADYATSVVASRLFITFQLYALTERRYGRAAAFLVIAPLHAIGAGVRAHGARGGCQAFHAIRLAARYFLAHRSRP